MSVDVVKVVMFLVSWVVVVFLVVLAVMVCSWWSEYGLQHWARKRELEEKNERRKVIHLGDRDLIDREVLLESIGAIEQNRRDIGDKAEADCLHQVKRLVELFPRVRNLEDSGQPPHENG